MHQSKTELNYLDSAQTFGGLDLWSSMYFISKSYCNSWIVEERRETLVNFFCVLTVRIVKPSETKREE